MLGSLINIFRVADLRKKVLFTLAMIVVYRIGAHVPTPFIDPVAMQKFFRTLSSGSAGGVFSVVDMFSGGAFSQMTIFALGIMPYISASIVLQLLTVVWPRLERISKEGEAGRKKINQWTRYSTVVLALFQGIGLSAFLQSSGLSKIPDNPLFFTFTTAVTMASGTCFLMWLGEKITEHGIGNGISLIIAVGILCTYPLSFATGLTQAQNQTMSWLAFLGVLAMMIIVGGIIVLMQESNRKIPVQHARRMVGRKVMQGGNTFLPLKINTAGVIPVIFSSALLSFPAYFLSAIPGVWGPRLNDWISPGSSLNLYNMLNLSSGGIFNLLKVFNMYTIVYAALTAFFCFFYTALTFNPVDLADNLKKSGAFIPGHKPGKPTSEFINHTLVRITVVGALFLVVVALVPNFLSVGFDIPFNFAMLAGGTGLIIVVGVFLDTMKQIESQLMMRHYEGFSAKGTTPTATRRIRRK